MEAIKWKQRIASMPKIGDLLLRSGAITKQQLAEALEKQKTEDGRLGDILQKMGYITEADILTAFGSWLQVPTIYPFDMKFFDVHPIDANFFNYFPTEVLDRLCVIPFRLDVEMAGEIQRWVFHVVMSDIWQYKDVEVLCQNYIKVARAKENISGAAGMDGTIRGIAVETVVYLAPRNDIVKVLNELAGKVQGEKVLEDTTSLSDEQASLRQVREILTAAIQQRASDIHISPLYITGGLWVRFRVDGVLKDVIRNGRITPDEYNVLTNKIMHMANMDPTRKREPQDGTMQFIYRGKSYDIRVASILTSMTTSTLEGVKVQLRVLYPESYISINDLGLAPKELAALKEIYLKPSGVFLVTGPTGSGKTTTLYSILKELDLETQCCYTVEDPVEYVLEGAYQIPVAPKEGRSFAAIMKELLRLDPDIVFLGEMRDPESANIAMQLANTGHSVFSTIHTNTAYTVPQRLLSMGIPEYLMENLNGVMSQRLVRVNCPHCTKPYKPNKHVLERLGLPVDVTYYRGTGKNKDGKVCPHCNGTGYLGRTGIYELLPLCMLEGWQNYIKDPFKLRQMAIKAGFPDIMGDARRKAEQGLISPDALIGILARSELMLAYE
ncbi:GspE/PulE family protein [Thermovirga lienii]|uniref:GspE/PulE family protein n=1 Tax=Thermovirga lienii TaxID=336261 RepID=UPI002FE28492